MVRRPLTALEYLTTNPHGINRSDNKQWRKHLHKQRNKGDPNSSKISLLWNIHVL